MYLEQLNFSLTIDVMMVESTINSLDQGTQGPLGVNTFLNLFYHWLLDFKYNFTPTGGDNTIPLEDWFELLEDWFELWRHKKTNNITN